MYVSLHAVLVLLHSSGILHSPNAYTSPYIMYIHSRDLYTPRYYIVFVRIIATSPRINAQLCTSVMWLIFSLQRKIQFYNSICTSIKMCRVLVRYLLTWVSCLSHMDVNICSSPTLLQNHGGATKTWQADVPGNHPGEPVPPCSCSH